MNILQNPDFLFDQYGNADENERKLDALMDSPILTRFHELLETSESSFDCCMNDVLINLRNAQSIINSIADSKV